MRCSSGTPAPSRNVVDTVNDGWAVANTLLGFARVVPVLDLFDVGHRPHRRSPSPSSTPDRRPGFSPLTREEVAVEAHPCAWQRLDGAGLASPRTRASRGTGSPPCSEAVVDLGPSWPGYARRCGCRGVFVAADVGCAGLASE